MTSLKTALYDRPDWYDLLYGAGTADEAWLLERINTLHGTGGKRWLEPACGTGRHLVVLSKRGYLVTGYDSNEKMISYARRRLAGSRASLLRADMSSFRSPERFDLAFCLVGTFRHLLTGKTAAGHLKSTAGALKPGGLYILGMDLTDYAQAQDDEETWTARRGRRLAEHAVLSLAPDSRRRERIINFLSLTCGKKKEFLEASYDLRSYDARQFKSLVKASPLRLAAVYGPDGKPSRLDPRTKDAYFVLKKG